MARDESTSGGPGVGGFDASLGARGAAPGGAAPGLGRSPSDLATDSGPAGAPADARPSSDPDSGLFSGTGDPGTDPDAGPGAGRGTARGRRFSPDTDPDTRVGLRPVTDGDVVPDHPAYDASPAGTRAATGAVAGLVGAAVLVAVMYALHWSGLIPGLTFVAAERAWLGTRGAIDHVLGVAGFLIAGALWGALFGLLFRRPTVLKGMLFGFAPTLFLWLVMAPLMGRPRFMGGGTAGLLLPVLFNVLIWGTIVGHYAARWLRPAYTTATTPGR